MTVKKERIILLTIPPLQLISSEYQKGKRTLSHITEHYKVNKTFIDTSNIEKSAIEVFFFRQMFFLLNSGGLQRKKRFICIRRNNLLSKHRER